MSKELKVCVPFFVMEVGDVMKLSEDGKTYYFDREDKYENVNDRDDISSSYSSHFEISTAYAKDLIEDGYLTELVEKTQKSDANFVNVFDEIDSLLNRYNNEKKETDESDDYPCVKLEKQTVYSNLIKVLTHLKNLRK